MSRRDAIDGACNLTTRGGLVAVRDICSWGVDVFASCGWCLFYLATVTVFSTHLCLGWQKRVCQRLSWASPEVPRPGYLRLFRHGYRLLEARACCTVVNFEGRVRERAVLSPTLGVGNEKVLCCRQLWGSEARKCCIVVDFNATSCSAHRPLPRTSYEARRRRAGGRAFVKTRGELIRWVSLLSSGRFVE